MNILRFRSRFLPLLLTLYCGTGAGSAQVTFSTFAGIAGSRGSADGTNGLASFSSPTGVALDSSGNVYVSETVNNTIRKITSQGVVSTLAGEPGMSGSTDGTNTAARFSTPSGLTVDSGGNVYVADYLNHTIRRITPAGVVSTFAGTAGMSGGADGTGAVARFSSPSAVAVDTADNVYVADTANNAIRKITPAGVVTTLAGAFGTFGSADGAGSAARFFLPFGIAVDAGGTVYVADTFNQIIRKITPAGVVTTLAGAAGQVGLENGVGSAARFRSPKGIAVDGMGTVYVADAANHSIRRISAAGEVTTYAGLSGFTGSDDGKTNRARFLQPTGIASDAAGNLFVADTGNQTIRQGLRDGAPAIASQPEDTTVLEGGVALFSVTATGDAPLTYQWRLNGTNLAGETASSLSVSNVTSNLVGSAYSVLVGNPIASILSRSAVLAIYTNYTNTIVEGTVRDAVTGAPVTNVLVSIAGTNVFSDAGGNYRFDPIPALPLKLYASRTGYVTFSSDINLLVGVTNQYEFAMSTAVVDSNTIRLVLNWGISPTDLDSHLRTPVIGDKSHRVYFGDRGELFEAPFAALDWDDTSGFGPETTTITNLFPGTYYYYVHQFSSGGNFPTSGGVVRVYTIDGLVNSFPAPVAGEGRYWYVCAIDGLSRSITPLNFLSNAPPATPSGPVTILTQPMSAATTVGSNALVHVVVSGSGPIAFQWRLNGTNIANATNSFISFTNLTRGDSGTYSVFVTNAQGSVASGNALFRVFGIPRLDPLVLQTNGSVLLRVFDETGPLFEENRAGIVVQSSTNIAATNWVALPNTSQIVNGKIEVQDTAAPQFPFRFYRVLEQ